MKKSKSITRVTAKKARTMIARGECRTDWKRVHALTQKAAIEDEGQLLEG
jgi:hypothetical protein